MIMKNDSDDGIVIKEMRTQRFEIPNYFLF